MNVTITDKEWYQAWVVSADFETPKIYLVYMELFNINSGNYFHEKHMRHPASEGLSRRDLSAFDAAELAGRADAVAKTNVKLKPNSLGLEAKGAPKTNTGIDWNKIDVKMVAYKFAEALLKRMLNGGFGDHLKNTKSAYVKELEVDLGTPCVVSAGKDAGVASKIKIGGERISTLNGKNQVSFKIDHCGGGG